MSTIAESNRETAQFTADAGQTDFACDFPAMQVAGSYDGLFATLERGEDLSTLTVGVDFDVVSPTASAFTARLTVAAEAGDKLVFYGRTRLVRERQNLAASAFRASVTEADMSQLFAAAQEARRDLNKLISGAAASELGVTGAALLALALLNPAADRVPYFSGATTAALQPLTTTGRGLMGAASRRAAQQAIGLERGAEVRMVAAAGEVAWAIYKADGTVLDASGTTTTGFQEGLTYALTRGLKFKCYGVGEGVPGVHNPTFITCHSPVYLPSIQIACVEIENLTLYFPDAGTENGIVFDSAQNMDWKMKGGQVIYNGPGAAVLLHPRTGLPLDLFSAVDASRIEFCAICAFGEGGVGWRNNTTDGGIVDNEFVWQELNGGEGLVSPDASGAVGFLVEDPPAMHSFSGNRMVAGTTHLWSQAGFRIGTTTAGYPYNNRGNTFLFNEIQPDGASAIGIDCYGSSNQFLGGAITDGQGDLYEAIHFHDGANTNIAQVSDIFGWSHADVTDTGAVNRVLRNGSENSMRTDYIETPIVRIFGAVNGLLMGRRGDNAHFTQLFADINGTLTAFDSLSGNTFLRVQTTGRIDALLAGIVNAADDAAAAAAGVPVGGFYRTGSALKIRAA